MYDVTRTTGAKLAAKQRRAEHWEKHQQIMDLDFEEPLEMDEFDPALNQNFDSEISGLGS